MYSRLAVDATVENMSVHAYVITPNEFTLDAATEESSYEEAPSKTATITANFVPETTDPINDRFVVNIMAKSEEPETMEPYTVYANDRWNEEGTTEFPDVLVNQVIEFYITDYAEEMGGDSSPYYYVGEVTGNTENMELVTAEHGYSIKFTEAGTYNVTVKLYKVNDDTYSWDQGLTFTVQ